MGVFDELLTVSVNDHTEKKTGKKYKDEKTGKWIETKLTYLSWPFAWAEVKKRYPEAAYTIWKDTQGRPYTYDEATGYMVYTAVTIEGITHEMWLPVMDGGNNAMKSAAYDFTTNSGTTKHVDAATMFDINKTLMRCLVKNLAMFGLGLYIYAGEDLPEGMDEKPTEPEKEPTKEPEKAAAKEPAKQAAKTETKASKKAEPAKPESKAPAKEPAPAADPQATAVAGAELKLKVLRYANEHYTADQARELAKHYNHTSLNELTPADCHDFCAFLKLKGRKIDE